MSLGESTVYHWKENWDVSGEAHFKPNGFEINHRYPLVIQNQRVAENGFGRRVYFRLHSQLSPWLGPHCCIAR